MRPSTHQKIIEAAGKNYGAATWGAPLNIQQRFHANLMRLLAKYDVDADEYAALGAAWWRAKVMKGPSVDW